MMAAVSKIRNIAQEARELGMLRTTARFLWECKVRSGIIVRKSTYPAEALAATSLKDLIWPKAPEVSRVMVGRVPAENIAALERKASEAMSGRIQCFGQWYADFGNPIDWRLQPVSGGHWPAAHWSQAIRGMESIGDVKYTWEVGRFPHAYHMARAAAFEPAMAESFAQAFFRQIEDFRKDNPFDQGIQWHSSQEIAVRLWAWLFGLAAFQSLGIAGPDISKDLYEGAVHVDQHIEFARFAVYNNHLLSEALCLYMAGTLLPGVPESLRWRKKGLQLLNDQADIQTYPDGGYIQNSHNYHRFAMQVYLLAWMFAKREGMAPPEWRGAMERSLDFLYAHQNPADGRLPNYGANDGALPLILSTCDYSDFRPTLQALSLATRGERIYGPGPWDEEAAWFLGPGALDAPLAKRRRSSVSFAFSGYHVLRGSEEGNFGAFRCGTIMDRMAQIDMLHLDVWWRGHNVIADGGSYSYNGPAIWHEHFYRTASHNTIKLDERDQMLHIRRFKALYWTRAKLLHFEDRPQWALCIGEHYGYSRHPGRCVHRRSTLFLKDDLWIIVDQIEGTGTHNVRLQWLGGDFPYSVDPDFPASMNLATADGPFRVTVFNDGGQPAFGDVVAGQPDPPRGWLSRYYGEKTPVPSLAVEVNSPMPVTLVTVLGPHVPKVSASGNMWAVEAGGISAEFSIGSTGMIPSPIKVASHSR